MNKKLISICLLLSLIFSLTCCTTDNQTHSPTENTTNKNEINFTTEDISNKNLLLGLGCAGDYGYYEVRGSVVYFFDYKTNKMVVLCNKPNCKHNDSQCNGFVVEHANDSSQINQSASSVNFIVYQDNHIYLFCTNGNVLKMNFDGTNHKKIATIDSKYGFYCAYMENNLIYINVFYSEEENHNIVEKSCFIVFDLDTNEWHQTNSYERNADTLLGVYENTAVYFYRKELPTRQNGMSFEEMIQTENNNPCSIYTVNLENSKKEILCENTEGNMSPAIMLDDMIYFHSRNDETICSVNPENGQIKILKQNVSGKIVFDVPIEDNLYFLRSKKITADFDPSNEVKEFFNTQTNELCEAYKLETNIGWNDGFRGILATTPDSYIMIYKADFVVEEVPGAAEPSVVDMKPYVGIIKKTDFWNKNYNFTEVSWF